MTDLLSGSDLARVELPPGVTGFGFTEVRYLLARHGEPAAATARELLGLDAAPEDDWVLAAGLASLAARGLVAADREVAQSRGEAALLEVLLCRGHRWTGVAMREGDDGQGDLLVVIEAPGVVGLLQPRVFGTWFVSLSAAEADVQDPSALVTASLLEARARHDRLGFAIETRTLDGVVGRRYARPADDGWAVSDTLDGPREHVALEGTEPLVRSVLRAEAARG